MRGALEYSSGELDSAASATILLVDHDERSQFVLTQVFERAGYRVAHAADADAVPALVARHGPDLILLALDMPCVSEFTLLRGLQAFRHKPGMIVLTRSTDDEDVIQALSSGADDYLTTPVHSRVVLAHVAALLRRTRDTAAKREIRERLSVGDVLLNGADRTVSVGDRSIALTPIEYDLLRAMMRAPGHVFLPQHLLEQIWGAEYMEDEDLVRTHIYRLRRKLERDPHQPEHLRNRPGIGYFFAEPESAA
jgi:DNA-binding response OmpR family regulator